MDEEKEFPTLRRKDTPHPFPVQEAPTQEEKRPRLDSRRSLIPFDERKPQQQSPQYKHLLSKQFSHVRGRALLSAPITAVNGISQETANSLSYLLNVSTIEQLANSPAIKNVCTINRIANAHAYEDAGIFDTSIQSASTINPATPTAAGSSSQNLAESICGSDERERVDARAEPFDKICFLTLELENGAKARGTGFYVDLEDDDPNLGGVILTAAHCLFDNREKRYMKRIHVSRSRNGDELPYGMETYETSALRVPDEWKRTAAMNADYGIIKLNKKAPVKGFKVIPIPNDAALRGANITTAGYPADKPGFHMWMDKGPIKKLERNKVLYNEDTFGGQSGSPVWTNFRQGKIAVGIHSYGGCPNSATRITDDVLNQIHDWMKGDVQ